MSFVLSPNMSLPIPAVGQEAGPTYAFDVNNALTLIDQHNHAPGSGVQINPAGININASLPFNDQQATNLQATVYTPQTSLSTLNAVYVSGVDLYFNDGNGDPPIQITKAGAVNATSSGIVSGTASASFVGGVLVVDQSANTPANIQAGSYLMGNNTAFSNFLTLAPPNAMAANYQITFPNLPTSTSFMTITTSGVIGDNISTSQGIARTMQAPVGQVTSLASATVGAGTTTVVTSVTLTTTGRPVMVFLTSAGGTSYFEYETVARTGSGSPPQHMVTINRDSGAQIYSFIMGDGSSSGNTSAQPSSTVTVFDAVGAGSHTYTLSMTADSLGFFILANAVLVAYEL